MFWVWSVKYSFNHLIDILYFIFVLQKVFMSFKIINIHVACLLWQPTGTLTSWKKKYKSLVYWTLYSAFTPIMPVFKMTINKMKGL